jgi:hypothetical protein
VVANAALTQPCADPARLGAGSGPQTMVDDEGGHDAVACASPAVGKQAERQAVGAAGNRDRKVGCALERSERRDQGGELDVVQA